MDTPDIVDDVNALLKLGVGDAYRLEHIKQSYIDNKTIWITDANYLDKLREKYLTKYNTATLVTEEEPEDDGKKIHCWKCGKKTPLRANFCMVCGAPLFDVGAENQAIATETKSEPKTPRAPINMKIPIMIIIPVLILIVIGGVYAMGYFDNILEKPIATDTTFVDDIFKQKFDPDNPSTRCGPGTMYDENSHSCILDSLK